VLLLVLGEDDRALFRLGKPKEEKPEEGGAKEEKPEEGGAKEETVFFHHDDEGNLSKRR